MVLFQFLAFGEKLAKFFDEQRRDYGENHLIYIFLQSHKVKLQFKEFMLQYVVLQTPDGIFKTKHFPCEEHKKTLTKTVMKYYCITRTHILYKKHNNIYGEARKEERKYRKLSKLVGNSKDVKGK